jgi:hypothetical protein
MHSTRRKPVSFAEKARRALAGRAFSKRIAG